MHGESVFDEKSVRALFEAWFLTDVHEVLRIAAEDLGGATCLRCVAETEADAILLGACARRIADVMGPAHALEFLMQHTVPGVAAEGARSAPFEGGPCAVYRCVELELGHGNVTRHVPFGYFAQLTDDDNALAAAVSAALHAAQAAASDRGASEA